MENDQYSPEFLKFIQDHKDKIPPLTSMEQKLMQFLVKHKIGGFERIVKIYRECTK